MDLFNTEKIINLLPYDGVVNYHGKVLKQKEAGYYLNQLLHTIEWKNDEAIILASILLPKEKRPGILIPTIHTPIQIQQSRHSERKFSFRQ